MSRHARSARSHLAGFACPGFWWHGQAYRQEGSAWGQPASSLVSLLGGALAGGNFGWGVMSLRWDLLMEVREIGALTYLLTWVASSCEGACASTG